MDKPKIVLLDNGHGKETAGKRSPIWKDGSQLFEWEYARKLCDAIFLKLQELNIYSVKVVPEDDDISLTERANRVNRFCEQGDCILISIHCNAGNGTGWECWTTTKKNNSDKLANIFVETFKDLFPDKKCRGHKEKDFTILYKSNCPCVLTENFFMDTESDCKFLMSIEGFDKIVDLHVKSILRYLEYNI
jgi:N-acetylmuramoyl-L-alanine amidase